MILEKKANIPVTFLVLGVLALCFIALISFYGSNREVQASFTKISVLILVDTLSDKLLFYSSLISSGLLDGPMVFQSINSMYSDISLIKTGSGIPILESISLSIKDDSGKPVVKAIFVEKKRTFLFFTSEKETLCVQYPYYSGDDVLC